MLSKPILPIFPPKLLQHGQNNHPNINPYKCNDIVVPQEPNLILQLTVWKPCRKDQHEETCRINDEFVDNLDVVQYWFRHWFVCHEEPQGKDGSVNVDSYVEPDLFGVDNGGEGEDYTFQAEDGDE